MKPADLKQKLTKAFPEYRWIAEPVVSDGVLASVSCQISDRKRCSVVAVVGGFEIEMTNGDTRSAQTGQRQWACGETIGDLRRCWDR